jgi:hypothetical protein
MALVPSHSALSESWRRRVSGVRASAATLVAAVWGASGLRAPEASKGPEESSGPVESKESMSAVPLLAEIRSVGERANERMRASDKISIQPGRNGDGMARAHRASIPGYLYHATLRNVGAR